MDSKTLHVLEYPKILARLAEFCDFSGSADLARALTPTPELEEALVRLAETTEARNLLVTSDLTIGGAHDIREQVDLCAHGGVLDPKEMLDVQSTLVSMRTLRRYFEKHAEASPRLADIACRLPAPAGLIESISRCITDTGEVADSASPKLYDLRRQVRVAHDRLMARLQRYLTDPTTAAKLQDAVITQRDGRYVIPLRAEFKGQVKSIIHDQSSTGATLFVEPLAVVELNNAYREAQIAERDEVRRILAALSGEVGALAGEIVPGVAALAELDLAFAKGKYAQAVHGSEPILKPASKVKGQTSDHPDLRRSTFDLPTVKLLDARHPLLDPETVVPVTIDPAAGTFALVITGPNTGGKTVTLKTVGLLAVMAQSGLHIPAQSGSELPCFAAIFADIGDEQSIEQSLSTFSGHITNIVHILKKADKRALVILDELGAGTDPQEGAALARAILSSLLREGITTFVATHYPELKTFAHTTAGVVNASLEFNVQTLRPTFKLTIGLPGRSNALAIAGRLGLPQEIIEAAKSEINPDDLRADKLIGDIHRQRKIAFKESEKAERSRSEARKLERQLEERLEKIEEERQKVLEQARAEGELEVEVLKTQLKTLKAELKKARQPLEALEAIEEKVELAEEKIQMPVKRRKTVDRQPSTVNRPRSLAVGDKVVLKTLGNAGTILSIDEDQAEVQAGSLRMRVPLEELKRKAEETSEQPPIPFGYDVVNRKSSIALAPSPGLELDLRGMMSEDALDKLETYLDKAYMAGMPFVRIIHGKGTGKLRTVVRQALKGHPHVKSFEEGGDKEGGEGVTVAKLAS
ncbi:MAG: DNA mismatch repair protein MutS2 [Anaerolineaceae bacterium]|nr:MAG: DNA mismatch repair protein MutS2 [Anaerolineaceae bacterium]